jgi:hypothetical protein
LTVALKPAQAYCKRCKQLFCYFQLRAARFYCGPCVSAERHDLLAFEREREHNERILRAYQQARAA